MAIAPGTHTLGPDDGTLVRTGKSGAAAKAGHNLRLEVTRWEAVVEAGETTSMSLTADSRSLRVVEGSGGVSPLGDEEKAGIAQTIDEDVLKGGAIAFRSERVDASPAGDHLDVQGELDLLGVRRPIAFSLDVTGEGRLTGGAKVTQTEWDIKPFSALFGTLKVADVVEVGIDARVPVRIHRDQERRRWLSSTTRSRTQADRRHLGGDPRPRADHPVRRGRQVIERTSPEEAKAEIKVRMGAMSMTFKGTVTVAERDDEAHRALLRVKSRDTGGQGYANADVVFSLSNGAGRSTLPHRSAARRHRWARASSAACSTRSSRTSPRSSRRSEARRGDPADHAARARGRGPEGRRHRRAGGPGRPVFRGNGENDYVCVECGTVLAASMDPDYMDFKVRVRCAQCRTVNVPDTDEEADRERWRRRRQEGRAR